MGNRRSATANGTTSYTYLANSNRLSNVGAVDQGFDANGGVTSVGSTSFKYNVRGRMRL